MSKTVVEEDKKSVWNFKLLLWTAYSDDIVWRMLGRISSWNTLWEDLNTLTFYDLFMTSIQYVYVEPCYKEPYLYIKLLNSSKRIKTIITIFLMFLYSWYKLVLYYTTYVIINLKKTVIKPKKKTALNTIIPKHKVNRS